MPLSWNEIKIRAAQFSKDWGEYIQGKREEAEAQTFENEFFNVFGVNRRKVATFEAKVVKLDSDNGYIDLLWPGYILIEMKTPGKDLDKAYAQAMQYVEVLPQEKLPHAVLICDFVHFHHYNLDKNNELTEFPLEELADHAELFADIAGYENVTYRKEDSVNVAAAEQMAKLHDALKAAGYTGHPLEVLLVRLVFCMFADDSGIWNQDQFINLIKNRTNEDGSDLGMWLPRLFQVLNTSAEKRASTLDKELASFPYINGGMFAEQLPFPDFDSKMRSILLDCCSLNWSMISPAIFGSMFQGVMDAEERRNLGAHYTSEENIMKLIHPLFLDELWDEFETDCTFKGDTKEAKLKALHEKIASLKFLDPACGCGNFLVITYRELRILELELLKELNGKSRALDISNEIKLNVDQFYGIELEEFPCRIAQTAMWLMDHLMNRKASEVLGEYFVRIPLHASAHIVNANSLTTDWESVVPKSELSYILGNPPFVGARIMSETQKAELMEIFQDTPNNGNLDYVTCWYKKAANYIQGTAIECAFVSTNSICQGEQVAILWKPLMEQQGIKINFAHQTFKWSNEAKGKAAVYCIIVGFSLHDRSKKQLFTYETVTSAPQPHEVKKINGYLIDAETIFIESRTMPLCDVPEIGIGNKPIDDGNYLFTEEEKNAFVKSEPLSEKYFHKWLGSDEFINRYYRWCLYLGKCPPNELKQMPEVLKRIEAVKKFRLESKSEGTRKIAATPTRFHVENIPDSTYVLIPEVSSEKRNYIPMGFITPDILSSNLVKIVPDATLYHFGILTSGMHMAWMRYVCGRLKSDYRYSKDIVYNNFPWPAPTDKQKADIEAAAQTVLDARANYPDSSLADLYDPDTMPADLLKAHQKLDRLVEKAYGKSFDSDAARVSFLFQKYQELTMPLVAGMKGKGKK
jgi:hypothetical protein